MRQSGAGLVLAILSLGLLYASFLHSPSSQARRLAQGPVSIHPVSMEVNIKPVHPVAVSGIWNWLGGLANHFLQGAVSTLGGSAMHWVLDQISGRASPDSKMKQVVSSLSNISSVLGRMDQSLEELVGGIAALNSQLASMEATLQYIAAEIHELVNHFKYEEIEEAYAFIKQKHHDFAGCLQDKDCLAKGPGSLFEFCHNDPTCENQLVNKLETDLQTIHSFLVGSIDPITHQSKDPLINLTFRLTRNSSTTGFSQCLLGAGWMEGWRDAERYCEVGVALPMISYIMQAGMVQLQGFNIYVSILDRWNYTERAATATQQFRSRLDQQFAMAHGQFSAEQNMSTRVFEIAQDVEQTIIGLNASETYMNGSTGLITAHCIPCPKRSAWAHCLDHSPVCEETFCEFTRPSCLTAELVRFSGIDSLCCAGLCNAPRMGYPPYCSNMNMTNQGDRFVVS